MQLLLPSSFAKTTKNSVWEIPNVCLPQLQVYVTGQEDLHFWETTVVWIASAVVILSNNVVPFTDVESAKNYTIHCCTWKFRITLPLTHPHWVRSHETQPWSWSQVFYQWPAVYWSPLRWFHSRSESSTWQCFICFVCVWMVSSESFLLIPIKLSESRVCHTRLQSSLLPISKSQQSSMPEGKLTLLLSLSPK